MSKGKRNIQARSRTPPENKSSVKPKNTGYSNGSASFTRQAFRQFFPIQSSPQADIDSNLNVIRNRSYDISINSPIGRGIIETQRSNVVGAGLVPSPKIDCRILGLTPAEAKEWQRKTLAEFKLWADSVTCDLYRKNNFWDMQNIALVGELVNGDSFALPKYGKPTVSNPYALKIQLIESNRVCSPGTYSNIGITNAYSLAVKNTQNGNDIINGVEIDKNGAVVAYWIANRPPYDPTNLGNATKWERVVAFGPRTGLPLILQVSHEDRPEQYRGVPQLAPVIEEILQISRYTRAELTAAIVRSFFTLFFKEGSSGSDIDDVLQSTYEEKYNLNPNDFVLGSGTMNMLPPGWDIETIDSKSSISTYEPFVNTLITMVGAGLNIPAEVIMGKFNSSYSAARGALNQAYAIFKQRRVWFARDFCQPIYEMWLAEAIATGRVKAPGYGTDPLITKAWNKADWFGPVNGLLDPVKEVQAAQMKISMGVSTHEREAAELTGTDFEDNVDVLALENEKWSAAGLPKNNQVTNTEEKEEQNEILEGNK